MTRYGSFHRFKGLPVDLYLLADNAASEKEFLNVAFPISSASLYDTHDWFCVWFLHYIYISSVDCILLFAS